MWNFNFQFIHGTNNFERKVAHKANKNSSKSG